MTVEENLRLADALTKALNDRDLDRFESLHSKTVTQRDPANAGPITGPKALRASTEPFLKAFPDLRLVLERKFGQGDWVSVQGHAEGTQTGPLENPGGPRVPPTNRRVQLPYAFIARVEGGKFAETYLYYDQASFMSQLGITPPPPATGKS